MGVDDWSALLAVALPVVRQLPERLVDVTVKRVATLPPGRLVSGRSREDLARVLVRGGVWELVEAALPADAPRPWADPGASAPDADDAERARLEQQVAHLQERTTSLSAKVADLRAEVDDLRRERDGAVARAAAAATAEAAAVAAREAAEARAVEAEAAAAAADERVERAVARSRRRDDSEVEGLRADLRAARRERDELRTELATTREQVARLEEELAAAPTGPTAASEAAAADDSTGRRGRPSRLPDGIAPGTTRAAEWLVAEGRVVLVDGYNVTRTTRPDLTFEEQRRWLEEAVGALAQRRHVDATIIWDSRHGAPSTRRTRTGLTVRFTREGATADDELVLHVQLALDPTTPVVVVTDDAELRARLAEHGVDLLDSRSFTWLL